MSSFDQSRGQGFVVDGKAAYGGIGKLVTSRRKADVHTFNSGEGTSRTWAMLRSFSWIQFQSLRMPSRGFVFGDQPVSLWAFELFER